MSLRLRELCVIRNGKQNMHCMGTTSKFIFCKMQFTICICLEENIIIIIIISLFKEDNEFSTNAILPFGPPILRYVMLVMNGL